MTFWLIVGVLALVMVGLVWFGRRDEDAWKFEAMAEEEEEADRVYGSDDVPPLDR